MTHPQMIDMAEHYRRLKKIKVFKKMTWFELVGEWLKKKQAEIFKNE